MGSLEKLSKSIAAVGELESKLKHSKAVIESVKVSYEMLKSKQRWLEDGLKGLDEKYELVRGVLKEVEQGRVQLKAMTDSIDQRLKELAIKEQKIHHFSEALNMIPRKEELDSMEIALNKREEEIDSREKQLKAKELEMEAELVERESLIALKEKNLAEREIEFDRKQKASAGDVLIKDSKRQRSGDGLAESGSNSEAKDAQKRRFSVGETWACFDPKDRMPRTYGKILGVFERGRSVRVEVEWMKPCSKLEEEREWISAGLPVGCGTFEPLGSSFEYPRTLFQPIFSAGNPCMIIPCEGETWAIYKDWNIKAWSSSPDIHKKCEYEIVEILPCPEGGSSSVSGAVKVAYLEKVRGSFCSFQRRIKKEEDAITIEPKSLYRFSHKVPSSKSYPNVPSGVFELDHNALPPGL